MNNEATASIYRQMGQHIPIMHMIIKKEGMCMRKGVRVMSTCA